MGAFNPDTGCTLPDSLVAFWKLEEASGIRFDSIVPGTGNAALFTETNSEFLSIADNADLSVGNVDFTIACWVFLTTTPTVNGNNYNVVAKRGAALEYRLVITDGLDQACWETSGGFVIATSFGGLSANTWHFIVVWHDSVADTVNIQVNNGTIDSSANTTGILDGTAQFRLGKDEKAGAEFMNGRIDQVGVWKRVLTASERTELYNSGNGIHSSILSSDLQTNLVAYWDLDETSGTRVDAIGSNDLTDNNTVTSNSGVSVGNSLTDNNTVTQAVGIVGNAAQFTAANSEWLSAASNSDLQSGDIDFAFSIWVYLDSKSNHQMFINKDSGSGREYFLYFDFNDDRFIFQILGTGSSPAEPLIRANSFGSPSLNTWHFIVAWNDSVANTVNIQVNAGTVDSTSYTGAGPTVGSTDFVIGRRQSGSDQWFMNGRIDEVGFWKKVLSAQEITDLYNSGSGNTFDFSATCILPISRKSDMLLMFD